MPTIRITAGDVSMTAELNDGPTSQKIWKALPITGSANTWGNEIYFSIPVQADEEPDAQADVNIGDLGYWPPGNAFCIFFGPTPASSSNQPRAASPVNPLGQVLGDSTAFKTVRSGSPVQLEAVES